MSSSSFWNDLEEELQGGLATEPSGNDFWDDLGEELGAFPKEDERLKKRRKISQSVKTDLKVPPGFQAPPQAPPPQAPPPQAGPAAVSPQDAQAYGQQKAQEQIQRSAGADPLAYLMERAETSMASQPPPRMEPPAQGAMPALGQVGPPKLTGFEELAATGPRMVATTQQMTAGALQFIEALDRYADDLPRVLGNVGARAVGGKERSPRERSKMEKAASKLVADISTGLKEKAKATQEVYASDYRQQAFMDRLAQNAPLAITQAVGENAAPLVGMLLTGGAAGAVGGTGAALASTMVMAGALEGGESYATILEATGDEQAALMGGMQTAAINGLLESALPAKLIGKIGIASKKKILDLIINIGMEAGTEGIQEVTQSLAEKMYADEDLEIFSPERIDGYIEAMFAGGGMALGVSVPALLQRGAEGPSPGDQPPGPQPPSETPLGAEAPPEVEVGIPQEALDVNQASRDIQGALDRIVSGEAPGPEAIQDAHAALDELEQGMQYDEDVEAQGAPGDPREAPFRGPPEGLLREPTQMPRQEVEAAAPSPFDVLTPEQATEYPELEDETLGDPQEALESLGAEAPSPAEGLDTQPGPPWDPQLGEKIPGVPGFTLDRLFPVAPETKFGIRKGEKLSLGSLPPLPKRDYKYRPIDTNDPEDIAKRKWYHGTTTALYDKLSDFDFGMALEFGLVGPGLYLTDNSNVAAGYAGRREGQGLIGYVLEGLVPGDIRLVDLEQPIEGEAKEAYRRAIKSFLSGYETDIGESDFTELRSLATTEKGWMESAITTKDGIGFYGSVMGMIGIREDQAAFVTEHLIPEMTKAGFDGWAHKGGVLSGGTEHNVIVLWGIPGSVGPLFDKKDYFRPSRTSLGIDPTAGTRRGEQAAKEPEPEPEPPEPSGPVEVPEPEPEAEEPTTDEGAEKFYAEKPEPISPADVADPMRAAGVIQRIFDVAKAKKDMLGKGIVKSLKPYLDLVKSILALEVVPASDKADTSAAMQDIADVIDDEITTRGRGASWEDEAEGLLRELNAAVIGEEVGAPKKTKEDPTEGKPIPRLDETEKIEAGPGEAPTNEATDAEGNPWEYSWAVIDLGDAKPSHKADGTPRGDYPIPGAQRRDRSRPAAVEQMQSIARKPRDAELVAGDLVGEGAPMMRPDGAIIDGNGRTAGLAEAYAKGNAKPYKQAVIFKAKELGIPPSKINKMKAPALVRVVDLYPEDQKDLARVANVQRGASMSATERAQQDAEKITTAVLDAYDPASGGDYTQARSRPFVTKFMETIPEAERGELIDSTGALSVAGVRRMQVAILAKAFPEPDVLEKLLESTDSTIASLGRAFLSSAPDTGKIRNQVEAGELFDADIGVEVGNAAAKLAELRGKGQPVDAYLGQQGLFGADLDPIEMRLLEMFERFKRKPAAISDILRAYNDVLRAQGSPGQGTLVEMPTPDKMEMLDKAFEKAGEVPQTELFADQEQPAEPTKDQKRAKSDKSKVAKLQADTEARKTKPKQRDALAEKNAAPIAESHRERWGKPDPGKATISIVGCCKAKAKKRTKAKDLYKSALYKASRAHAERGGRTMVIASAQHGLVPADQEVDPYDTALKSKADKERYAALVKAEVPFLLEKYPNLTEVEILAGAAYADPLRAALEKKGITVTEPLKGKQVGQRLKWLKSPPKEMSAEELLADEAIEAVTPKKPKKEIGLDTEQPGVVVVKNLDKPELERIQKKAAWDYYEEVGLPALTPDNMAKRLGVTGARAQELADLVRQRIALAKRAEQREATPDEIPSIAPVDLAEVRGDILTEIATEESNKWRAPFAILKAINAKLARRKQAPTTAEELSDELERMVEEVEGVNRLEDIGGVAAYQYLPPKRVDVQEPEKGFLRLGKRKKPEAIDKYAFAPEIEELFQKGLLGPPKNLWARVLRAGDLWGKGFFREWKFLPRNNPRWTQLRELLRRMELGSPQATLEVVDTYKRILKPLSNREYLLFIRKAVLDSARSVQSHNEAMRKAGEGSTFGLVEEVGLPMRFTEESLTNDKAQLIDQAVRDNAAIAMAVSQIRDYQRSIRDDLKEALHAAGDHVRARKLDTYGDAYMHHAMMFESDRLNADLQKSGEGRRYLMRRKGSDPDLAMDLRYATVQARVSRDMRLDAEAARDMTRIGEIFDEKRRLVKEAARQIRLQIKAEFPEVRERIHGELLAKFGRESRLRGPAYVKKHGGTDESKVYRQRQAEWKRERRLELRQTINWRAMAEKRGLIGKKGTHSFYSPMSRVYQRVMEIPESAALAALKAGVSQIIDPDAVRERIALGFPSVWLLPNELVAQLEEIDAKKQKKLGIVVKVSGWTKVWLLFNPRTIARYLGRNIVSDSLLAMTWNPMGVRHYWRAFRELVELKATGKPPSEDLRGFLELGGANQTVFGQEFNTKDQDMIRSLGQDEFDRAFSALRRTAADPTSAGMKPLRLYLGGAKTVAFVLESVNRFGQYLSFLNQVKSNKGKPKWWVGYGGSYAKEIAQFETPEEKAYHLSNDLLGAYDQVSVHGQTMRSFFILFWSFAETNFRTFYRITYNLAYAPEVLDAVKAGKLGNAAKELAKVSPAKASAVARFAILSMGMQALTQGWNHWKFPDEEDELPKDVRNSFHVIFGRSDAGEVIYFDRLGRFVEAADLVPLAHFPYRDLMDGRVTMREAITQVMWKDWADNLFNMITPWAKVPVEFMTGIKTFPSVTRFRYRDDQFEAIADFLQARGLYDYFRGRFIPGPKDAGRLERLLRRWGTATYSYRIQGMQSAYYNTLSNKREFKTYMGIPDSGGGPRSQKAILMREMREALIYGDIAEAKRFWLEYLAYSKATREQLDEDTIMDRAEQSLRSSHPLQGIQRREEEFRAWLTPAEEGNLDLALDYYNKLLKNLEEAVPELDPE